MRLGAVKALGELDVAEAKVAAIRQAERGAENPFADVSAEALAELRDDDLAANLTTLLRPGLPSPLVADLPRGDQRDPRSDRRRPGQGRDGEKMATQSKGR